MSVEFSYKRIRCNDIPAQVVEECKELFHAHYGTWSSKSSFKPGQAIKPLNKWVKNYLPIKDAWVSVARHDETLIGYATAVQIKTSHGFITWVTQLVVHKDYRNQLVGSKLLNSIWGYSRHYAWGLASANPFAIRALEKVTRRLCDTKVIIERKSTIHRALNVIPYLKGRNVCIEVQKSIIDTLFYQDISNIQKMLLDASAKNPWNIGAIKDGEEWLAVTFNIQRPRAWSESEFNEFQKLSDSFVKAAYEHMAKANPAKNHAWARRAKEEVNFLIGRLSLLPPMDVIDFGCGSGRHANEFKQHGFNVVGVDLSTKSIDWANKQYRGINFLVGDVRTINLNRQFDLGICLYDVIGSYADDQSNEQILRNISFHVKSGGYLVVSVMSFDYSSIKSSRRVTNDIHSDLVLLPATNSMQKSGEVFGPDVLLDEKSKVTYRKETFDLGDDLPEELVVRDRRYTIGELDEIFKKIGFNIVVKGYVSAGKFEKVDASRKVDKEILIIARKSLL